MTAIFFTRDLFFSSRIASAAGQCGMDMTVVMTREELLQRLSSADARLVLLDLGACGADVHAFVSELRSTAAAPVFIVAFGAHVDEATLSAARDGGCDEVFTRGQFSGQMVKVLTRYLSQSP